GRGPEGPRQAGRQVSARVACLLLWVAGCADTSASSAFKRAGEAGDVKAALARVDHRAGGVANGSGQPRLFLAMAGTGGSQIVAADLKSGAVLRREADNLAARMVVS